VSARVIKSRVRVCVGRAGVPAGQLTFVKDGRREYSVFAYETTWLADRDRFAISPDLPLLPGHVTRKSPTTEDSCFPFALADTAPDAWGKRLIARAHAKRRDKEPSLPLLTPFDYLAAVDDFSRIGALRLQDADGVFLRSSEQHRAPPLEELDRLYAASRAVEEGNESFEDLVYLQGKGTSLGGLRPKCTILEQDGRLAVGKFPSVGDDRSVPRGEVLALALACRAGINAAAARIVTIGSTPVAVIRRFDRTDDGARIPYLSGGSLLQASRHEDRSYTEVADMLRATSSQPTEDARELWRRLVFNLLITNVDDHLWNVGMLYARDGLWQLAPAFDVNPFPEKLRESKTWLSERSGPITSLEQLLGEANYFGLEPADAQRVVVEVASAVCRWREVATSAEVGLKEHELADFESAFEHADAEAARALML
jgi:serine/threonine-protein kinase HipA